MATEPGVWEQIKKEYLKGDKSQRALAEKYGVSEYTLSKHAIKGGWKAQRENKRQKVVEKIIASAAEAEGRRAERLSKSAEKLLGTIDDLIDNAGDKLGPRDLRDLTGAIKDIKSILEVRSDADLREQEARIKKLQREAERGDQPDREIRIVMSPELEALGK
jgi:molecular chaperone DnaK (HSP70)